MSRQITQTTVEPMGNQSCPDATTLRQFLHDELSEADAVSLPRHIDSCFTCQGVLERLVDNVPGRLEATAALANLRPDDTQRTEPATAPALAPIHIAGY